MNLALYGLTVYFVSAVAAPMQKQIHMSGASAGCISKYYNKDLGPLEILMMPLGEKLWLRAWLGMHMSNLLHMEGVDLAEVSQMEGNRDKRDISLILDVENESKMRSIFESIAPIRYSLLFQPFVKEMLFRAELQVNITCIHSTNRIVMHASNFLRVNELKIRRLESANVGDQDSQQNDQERNAQDHVEILRLMWYEQVSLCEILLAEPLIKEAHYRLDFKYEGPMKPENDGIVLNRYQHSNFSELSWFLGTNLKEDNAMKVFPCFYGSKYKAPIEIIVVHPDDMVAVTSSPLLTSENITDKPGWKRSHFINTPPITPSSLSICILNPLHFEQMTVETDSGIYIHGFLWRYDTPLQIQRTLNYLSLGVTFLEKRLDVPFPPSQLNILFMPNKSNTAEDFWGLILTGSNISPAALFFYLLKQWFGHLVTATNVNEEYVTRSLAYYYAYFCSLDLEEGCETGSKLLTASHADFIALENVKETMTIEEFKDHKMVLFLRMLNFSLSEQSFQRGIQVFLKYRSYRTFVAEDLWDVLDIQAWSDGTLDRTISTKDISSVWLSHDMQPLVTARINYKNNTLVLEQQVFARHWPYTVQEQKNILWPIPVHFITENSLVEGKPGVLVWLKEKNITLRANIRVYGEYYIVNLNNAGMFIVNYPDSNWRFLSEKLMFDGIEQHFHIPAETRATLFRNAWYLAVTGHLDFSVALKTILYLKYETDFSVWKTFAEVYLMVSWKLIGTGVEIKFDRFIGNLLLPKYANANFNTSHNFKETEALAYYILCKAGYEPALEYAKLEFDNWLIHHHEINHGVVSGVLRWIDEYWERGFHHVLHLLKEGRFPNIRYFLLTHLAANPNPEKIQRLLTVLLIDPMHMFSKAEIMRVLPAVSSCRTFLEFLTSEWQAVKERFESEPNMWQYILEQATKKCKTRDGIDRIETFYKSHHNDLGTSGNSLKHNIEIARRDMEFIYYQIPAFEESLNVYTNRIGRTVK